MGCLRNLPITKWYSRGQSRPTNRVSRWELDGFSNASNKAPPKFFPRVVKSGQIFGPNFRKTHMPETNYLFPESQNLFKNRIQMHHCSPRNTAMAILLPYSPLNSLPCQPQSVCWHPLPWSIDEPPNHISRTGIKGRQGCILCLLEGILFYLLVSIFGPSPVLQWYEYIKCWTSLKM